ncbi:unnamed protein product, partial [Chondrus crispus]
MFLKEVIIDGFKSYATRTTVSDFDPSFNAITGLNGSGKSNVLDSICFVLGITNLSQVRASSLQELVYKGGQAGVTKASVTLVFNNREKETAPVGYEQVDEITVTRQIVIGGRNKYLVNGTNAQPGRVQNLFHSVGLNVNNPHFLIMQGRITKVINMKPPEVLSMIEEAAGTKMYENKKEAALRTIERKERKVEEINSLLEDKINPSLQKLERERKHYLEWTTNNNEVEKLKRYLIADQYYRAVKMLKKNSGEGSELSDRVDEITSLLSSLEAEQKHATEKVTQLTKERAAQLDDGALEEQQSKVDDLGKKIVKLRTAFDLLRKNIATAESEVQPAEKNLEKISEELEQAETALLTGASQGSQSGAVGSAIDQLDSAKRAVSTAQTQIESLKLEQKHVYSELNSKAEQLAQDRANIRSLEAERKAAEKAISDARLAVHELDFDADAATTLESKLEEERGIVAQLREKVDHLSARLGSCDFQYSDPRPNFDRSKVHGLVAKLIRVKDPKVTTAIEVTAGGRLYQVVVDTDSTANDILRNGKLARRVTILPLNKIRHEILSRSKLEAAKQIEPSTEMALSLVGYGHEVANAIEHVFGRTLICFDMDAAKRVTFDNRVRTRSVTLEGDTYDPSGTASGGSSSRHGASVLTRLGELNDAEAELRVHSANLRELETQFFRISEQGKRFRQLQMMLQVRQNEAELLENRLRETATGRLLSEVEELRKRYNQDIPEALNAAKEIASKESEKVKELEHSMKDGKAAKEKALKEAEAALQRARASRMEASLHLQKLKDRHSTLLVEKETTEEEVKRLSKQLSETLEPSVAKLQEEVSILETRVADTRNEFEEAEKGLGEERERLASSNQALRRAKKDVEDRGEKMEGLSLEKAKLDSKIREAARGRSGAEKTVEKLEKTHAWIEQDFDQFGKAMHLFETAKQEYTDLMRRKGIIEKDKEKIEMVIAGLDEKKMVALEKTWRKVDSDFGNIFSDLLPGTSARLEPPEGKSVEDGLEIRVAFGDVWKDSLSELSGGQRSLIALSLILAMLRFKPAPMYILDEVDAALDLSHTQNIGRMLRRHFSGSQFIVVSLKEGMFGNANVIFRTKFVDGVSTIKRTANNPTADEEA